MHKPRMRTREKAIELLKQDDPGTSVTRSAIDRIIRAGKIPTARIGNKVLLNYDKLLELFESGFDFDSDLDIEPSDKKRFRAVKRVEI